MGKDLREETITTLPGEKTMDAIGRVLGNVMPVVVRPVLSTRLDFGRKRFVVSYRTMV